MLLNDLKQQHSLIYMERYVNVGSKTYSLLASRTETNESYRPESSYSYFNLPTLVVTRDNVELYEAVCEEELFKQDVTAKEVVIPIHPDTWSRSAFLVPDRLSGVRPGPSIRVSPTSSTRTVFVLHEDNYPQHFVKLHYPFFISRFKRYLRRKEIQNAVAATHEMSQIKNCNFAYLPESLGVFAWVW